MSSYSFQSSSFGSSGSAGFGASSSSSGSNNIATDLLAMLGGGSSSASASGSYLVSYTTYFLISFSILSSINFYSNELANPNLLRNCKIN